MPGVSRVHGVIGNGKKSMRRISKSEFQHILFVFDAVFTQTSFKRPLAIWGGQIEHRDTQVTFSALGQAAPVLDKIAWDDAEHSYKRELVHLLTPLLLGYNVKAGGTTSVDITRKRIDKEFGINQFLKHSGIRVSDTLFVGDALYEGGNDFAVTKTGVDVCQVDGPTDLLNKLSVFSAQKFD
jgi:phosphomannomutase